MDKETLKYINLNKINLLKQKLIQTDYLAIKYAEGILSEEEYAPIKVERQEYRNEINKIESELNDLISGN